MEHRHIGASILKILLASAGILLCIMAAVSPSFAQTQWRVGISGGDDGVEGFHLSIGEYYRVPHKEVIVVHERGICDEELPVVFFLAQRARVHPDAIVRLRLRGMSWMDITLHYGLCPDIYYVPVRVVHHHSGHDYIYYRDRRHHDWKHMRLKDRDIINQVNLKFISERHGYAPEKIIKHRFEGRSFTQIDRDVKHERNRKAAYSDHRDKSKQNRDHDHKKYDNGNRHHEKRGDRNGPRGNS